MSEEFDDEQCWECGEDAVGECPNGDCDDGAMFCRSCLENHNALEHDEEE